MESQTEQHSGTLLKGIDQMVQRNIVRGNALITYRCDLGCHDSDRPCKHWPVDLIPVKAHRPQLQLKGKLYPWVDDIDC